MLSTARLRLQAGAFLTVRVHDTPQDAPFDSGAAATQGNGHETPDGIGNRRASELLNKQHEK
jgi:hypothetical protein